MPPKQKRKRVVSPEPHAKAEPSPELISLTESADVYFEDGNIVLIAEDVAFRVHRGQMERHSVVFREMFAKAEQQKGAETYSGCPVVRLPDEQDELRDLLLALYGSNPFLQPEEPVIFNIFIISSKYLIESLRISAISALRQFYPDTLIGWDANRDKELALENVLTHANADIFLPAAYYRLCQYNPELVVTTLSLPPPIIATYFLGKTRLVTKFASFLQRELIEEGKTRHNGGYGQCRGAWGNVGDYAHSLLRDVKYIRSPDPLLSLRKLANEVGNSKICHDCRKGLLRAIEKERRSVWNCLPQIFRLEINTWEGLREAL